MYVPYFVVIRGVVPFFGLSSVFFRLPWTTIENKLRASPVRFTSLESRQGGHEKLVQGEVGDLKVGE